LDALVEVGHLGITAITPAYAAIYQQTPAGRRDLAKGVADGTLTRG